MLLIQIGACPVVGRVEMIFLIKTIYKSCLA